MKKSMISFAAFAVCIAFVTMSSFKASNTISSSKSAAFGNAQPITFFTSTTSADGSTLFGTVNATGGINATGSYVMTIQFLGKSALHCTVVLTFPNQGTLNIRMNCNMVTFNGQWQIINGTGAYSNAKGGGSLVMPNDVDEILTGSIRI